MILFNILKKKFHLIIFAIVTLIYYIFFIENSPNHDELVNITLYLHPELFFLKNFPNNHVLISIIGYLIETIFESNLIYFRLISFISFIAIIFILHNSLKNNILTLTVLTLITLSEYLSNYSFLFRGYYISSLLFVLIYFLLKNHLNDFKVKNLILIFIITNILILTLVSNLYLILPIIISIFIFDFQRKKLNLKIWLLYFILPTILIQILTIFITGVIWLKIFDINFFNIQSNFYQIFYYGIDRIYFHEGIKDISLFVNFSDFFKTFYKHPIILLIFLISFLISLKNILSKDYKFFDLLIFLFFIIFLIVNKFPPIRVFIPFVYFHLLYIFSNMRQYLKFNISNKIFYFLIFINLVLFYKLDHFKSINTYENRIIQIDKLIINCKFTNDKLSEIDKHMYYFALLKKCNDRNLKRFHNFYKTNRLDYENIK